MLGLDASGCLQWHTVSVYLFGVGFPLTIESFRDWHMDTVLAKILNGPGHQPLERRRHLTRPFEGSLVGI